MVILLLLVAQCVFFCLKTNCVFDHQDDLCSDQINAKQMYHNSDFAVGRLSGSGNLCCEKGKV